MGRIAGWLEPGGKVFVHVFSHHELAYAYESGWMAKHFFTAGTMPSHDLIPHFAGELALEEQWTISGLALRPDRRGLARYALDAAPGRGPRRFFREPTDPTRSVACTGGASSSWPAPSSGATAPGRSGASPTTGSSSCSGHFRHSRRFAYSRNSPRATTTACPPTETRSSSPSRASARAKSVEGRPISTPCEISIHSPHSTRPCRQR